MGIAISSPIGVLHGLLWDRPGGSELLQAVADASLVHCRQGQRRIWMGLLNGSSWGLHGNSMGKYGKVKGIIELYIMVHCWIIMVFKCL